MHLRGRGTEGDLVVEAALGSAKSIQVDHGEDANLPREIAIHANFWDFFYLLLKRDICIFLRIKNLQSFL